MESYKFSYDNKTYQLSESNCDYFVIVEEFPLTGIDEALIIGLLNQQEVVDFEIEYYDAPCQNCLDSQNEKDKYFKFLEYHFYVFSKNGAYVISNISKGYENMNFEALIKNGEVDNSYVLSIIICPNCGIYSIEIDQYDM